MCSASSAEHASGVAIQGILVRIMSCQSKTTLNWHSSRQTGFHYVAIVMFQLRDASWHMRTSSDAVNEVCWAEGRQPLRASQNSGELRFRSRPIEML